MTTRASFEYNVVMPLASLFIVRMLGLFMVLPVLALYGNNYTDTTPLLLGLALGVYGFSQALLQVPFGALSDRFGRKPLIAIGLGIFALGSVIAANAESIYGLIIGRSLQGAGAISGVVIAMVADLTKEENRTKAMAIIGLSIGITFSLALILGPLLTALGGIELIFWVTASLTMIGFVILFWLIPTPSNPKYSKVGSTAIIGDLIKIFNDRELQHINLSIFVLHFVLMALFLILPLIIEESLSISRQHHSWLYLSVLVASFILMLPIMIWAEKFRQVKLAIVGSIILLVSTTLILSQQALVNQLIVIGAICLFFVGFNYLEATLPSLMSKTAPTDKKGTASSIFSMCQFAGAGTGGFIGGWLLTHWGTKGVFIGATGLLSLWLIVSLTMKVSAKATSKQQSASSCAVNK